MGVKDVPLRSGHPVDDPETFIRWLDVIGRRQNIDDQLPLSTVSSADETYVFSVSASKTYKATVNQILSLAHLKPVNFSRAMNTATGTQAITGVGFTPTVVIFFSNNDATYQFSWGMDNVTLPQCIYQSGATGSSSGGASIALLDGAGNNQTAKITSLDADGFTLTWTKTGAPAGTAFIYALCLK